MDVEVSTPQPQTPASESHSAPDGTISGGVKTEPATDAATAAAAEVFAPISVDGAASAEGTIGRGVRYFCGRTFFSLPSLYCDKKYAQLYSTKSILTQIDGVEHLFDLFMSLCVHRRVIGRVRSDERFKERGRSAVPVVRVSHPV